MIVNAVAWHYNGFEKRWAAYNPCPFFSSTITGCIEKAQDVSQGGAIYNNSGFALVGLADFIDSLYAIKEAVYEQKRYTLAELTAMLRKNYEGCELDRLYLQNKIPKVGGGYGADERVCAPRHAGYRREHQLDAKWPRRPV